MAGLLETLIRPDREDDPERGAVIRAANILQVGEFQFLQLAYSEWAGKEMPERDVDRHFRHFIVEGNTPAWAVRHAQRIIDWDRRGLLDGNSRYYHRFDNLHYSAIPKGTRQFLFAVACLALVLGGGIMLSHIAAHKATSVLPPYFEEEDLPRDQPQTKLRGS